MIFGLLMTEYCLENMKTQRKKMMRKRCRGIRRRLSKGMRKHSIDMG